jgi:hypothetical protein
MKTQLRKYGNGIHKAMETKNLKVLESDGGHNGAKTDLTLR